MSWKSLLKMVVPAALAFAVAAPVAQAADLGGYKGSYKDEPDYGPPRYLWTGLYAGLQAGYAWGDAYTWQPGLITGNPQPDGFLGGATLGYNFQSGSIVWGIETDFSFADVQGSHGVTSANMDWLWTFRGRVGVDMNGWMPYLTGGLAVADVGAADNLGSGSDTVAGWTVGGGLEIKLDRNWSVKGEYLYVNLDDSFRLSGGPPPGAASLDDLHIVRAGINYKF